MEEYTTFAPNQQGHESGGGSIWSHCTDRFEHHPEAILPRPVPERQSRVDREVLTEQADEALALLTDATMRANSTAAKAIDNARRLHAVEGICRDRAQAKKMVLANRNGLLRVLRVLEQDNGLEAMSPRVWDALDMMMALSANASVLSTSKWPATWTWLKTNVPGIASIQGAWLESRFQHHLDKARVKIAEMIPVRLYDYRTAPSPREIAERIGITTEALRIAKANRCGLTSIDPEPKRDRDRRTAVERRKERGGKTRAEQTKTADLARLAADLDCDLSTVRRYDKKGPDALVAYIARKWK